MHILASEAVGLEAAGTAVDLEQSPADVVVLSFSDSDLGALAAAWQREADTLPTLRLASLKRLSHPLSVDLYIDKVIAQSRAVVVRCLGGLDYWRYGIERIAATARERGIRLAVLPGDDRADPRLAAYGTLDAPLLARLDAFLRHGGVDNAANALRLIANLIGRPLGWCEPAPVAAIAGVERDGSMVAPERLAREHDPRPAALVVFYRANLLAGDMAPVSALMDALEGEGLAALAVAVTSLKDPAIADGLGAIVPARRPRVIINATAFSALREDGSSILDQAGVPVLQAVLAGSTREAWESSSRGLGATDLAMNVVLPELDGRIGSRAVSFKAEVAADPRLEFNVPRHAPDRDRVAFVARQAAGWVRLGRRAPGDRRVAVILSDYPARAGRAGYAVGLDTAASAAEILAALAAAGYDVGGRAPGAAEIEQHLRGDGREIAIPLADYRRWLAGLPAALLEGLSAAWGDPAADPAARDGAFRLPALRLGNIVLARQPDRGASADRKSDYHDTARPPRHAYAAFYLWLRAGAGIDAMVHLGTHGTLEWLPGKAVALSAQCWPEALAGPLPVIYPFIVNNPGEAVAAKRRLSAVTIGHLTPPMTRAGLHGPLAELEALVEEYAVADGLDRRRRDLIAGEIIERAWASGLAVDCGLLRDMAPRDAIARLDAQLCDIKDLAVRDRLHVFARAPEPDAARDLAAAMAPQGVPGDHLMSRIGDCAAHERAALLAALDGRRVPPGPAGSPSRGRADVLPTGRNLTSMDPRTIPTQVAAGIGRRAAEEVVRRYLQDHGEHPRTLMLDLWASATLRTGGDDIAQALHYLGARAQWDAGSARVTGIELVPLAALGRPRIDVTLRISGLFRDIFEAQIALFDLAVRRIAALDEADEDNPLAAARRAGEGLARVFGGAYGTYGAGAAELALDGTWQAREELGRAYLAAASHAYGADGARADGDGFAARVAVSDALVHPQDDRERDILDGDGVADFAGGFAAAAGLLGREPTLYHLDTSRPDSPAVRTFQAEIARVVRGRLANPRWIEGMLRHGHRGVAEIAQGVDALYAFAATTDAVPGHLLDDVHRMLIAASATWDAIRAHNPDAAHAIAGRLQDALERGLWISRRNITRGELEAALSGLRLAEAAQ